MGFLFNRPVNKRMRVIIIGAGEVGFHIAEKLSKEDSKEVIVIDNDSEVLNNVVGLLDVQTIFGDASSPAVLNRAEVRKADIILVVTNSDTINIVSSLFAAKLAPAALTIVRIRNEEYTSGYEELFNTTLGINFLINPELEVVKNIEHILYFPNSIDYTEFANSKVKIIALKIEKGPLINCKLKDFKKIIPDHVIVAAIVRDEKLIIPSGNDKIKVNDIAYFTYTSKWFETIHLATVSESTWAKNICIVGGGNTGYRLAKFLEKRDFTVKLIEKKENRCSLLAEELGATLVLKGDGADQDLLLEENIGEMDAVITLTGSDEKNILIALLAKSLGTRIVIPIINKSAYRSLVEALGIQTAITPRLAAVDSIMRYIRRGKVLSVVSIGDTQAEVLEVVALKDSLIVQKPIVKLGLPKNALILAVIRSGKAFIPNGNTQILPDDHIIILVGLHSMAKIEEFLSSVKED